MKLLLIAQFGRCDHLDIEKFSDLDQVTSCVVKAFHQDLNVDITWPMFDDAAKGMVCLLTIIFLLQCTTDYNHSHAFSNISVTSCRILRQLD